MVAVAAAVSAVSASAAAAIADAADATASEHTCKQVRSTLKRCTLIVHLLIKRPYSTCCILAQGNG